MQRAKRQADPPASPHSLNGAALVSSNPSRWNLGALLVALVALFVAGCGTGVPLVGNDDAGVVISFDKPQSDMITIDTSSAGSPGERPNATSPSASAAQRGVGVTVRFGINRLP